MQEIKFGDVSATRVVEYYGDAGTSPEDITPCIPVELWRENRSWLQPDHVNADFTSYVGALQTWVLRSEGKTILVDTGAGNGRDRPLAAFAHLHTSFLADLAAAGVAPDEVDVVINTHLHLDHTGWNLLRWHAGLVRRHLGLSAPRSGMAAHGAGHAGAGTGDGS